jgi:hypothetical protein
MPALFPNAVERPRFEKYRDKAIEEIAKEVEKWERAQGVRDPDDCRDDLRSVLDHSTIDGYEAARELESRHGWSPDAQLVEILDGWHFHCYRAQQVALKRWVADYDIKPQYELGTRVRGKHGRDMITGVIAKIYDETGVYVVRRDTDAEGCGAHVNFEDAEALGPEETG